MLYLEIIDDQVVIIFTSRVERRKSVLVFKTDVSIPVSKLKFQNASVINAVGCIIELFKIKILDNRFKRVFFPPDA